MKATISNRIYLQCPAGSDLENKLVNELTYEIDQRPVSDFPRIVRNIERINDNIVSIPSGRLDLLPEHCELKDRRVIVDVDIPKPAFTLRSDQQKALHFFDGQSGIVNCAPGWGKSICALAIAHKFQQKTLIVCTTTNIREMWIKEIKKHFGFNPGVVGSGKFDISTPIVVGNIQTVRNREVELASEFGIVIIDEAHHCSATTFSNFLNSNRASIKIGLTGTLERKDGMHCTFNDYFGPSKFIGKVENTIKPDIHLYDVDYELSSNEFIPWANKVTELKKDITYQKTVTALAKSYAKLGHKVLVVSDRTEFLQILSQKLDNSVLITGEVAQEDREIFMQAIADGDADILLGTQSMFSEGVSLNQLSCIILATPINNAPLIEQLVGRIMRLLEGKLTPIVVDIRLMGNTGKRHRYTRNGVYLKRGWKTIPYTLGKLISEVYGNNSKFSDLV